MKVMKLRERIAVALFLDNIYENDDIMYIWQFDQTWESTALGFNSYGGNTFTSALTSVILKTDGWVDVYFNTKKAYTKKMTQKLMEDVYRTRMESVMNSHVYDDNSAK